VIGPVIIVSDKDIESEPLPSNCCFRLASGKRTDRRIGAPDCKLSNDFKAGNGGCDRD
jgi:hypothetical protein